MNVALDACSLINLHRGSVLDTILLLDRHTFFIGPIVRSEIKHIADVIDKFITSGRLILLPDNDLTLDEVADFGDNHNLGIGESECTLFGVRRSELHVCSDDRRARRIAADLLTDARVLGTADLLRRCVTGGLLTPQDAFASYELMRARGAFLPELTREAFIIQIPE